MTARKPKKQFPTTFRKPWNLSALAMCGIAALLILIAFLSINIEPRKTGDYLETTNSKQYITFNKNRSELGLLQRNIKKAAKPSDQAGEVEANNPMILKVGLYASNNYNINPQTPSFDGTGYIWFKWKDDLQNYMVKNNLQVWKFITPINLINSSGPVFVPTSQPIRMKDGSWYLTASYKGTFYIDDSDFRYHPFTRLNLPIMLEADDIILNYEKLRIEADMQGSGVGQFIDTSKGWVNTGWSLNSYRHHYDTDFGFGEGASDYSQLIYDIKYTTSTWHAFWKILVPISIVMAMIVGATKLDPVHYDVRLTMPVTVLLTLVFLQQGHNSDLPRLSYLTFLDEVYVVCYALTLGAFALMLWACRRYYNAIKIEDPVLQANQMMRLEKFDDYWPNYVIAAGIVSITIAWFTS